MTIPPIETSRGKRWTAYTLFAVVVLFLIMDITFKFVQTPESVAGTAALGFPVSAVQPLGVIELVCLILLLVPRTAPLGALLWTAYLGGAVAIHVRIQNPLFTHILFPVYIATAIWLSLYLRDPRVRRILAPLG
jgi:hypothetical protein